MTVWSITLVHSENASDLIMLDIDLPAAQWPFLGTLTVSFHAAKDTGRQYIETHFPSIAVREV